jgi:hypothetical protein
MLNGEPTDAKLTVPLVVMVTAILHGQKLRAEAFLHAISNHLHLKGIACTR